MKRKNDRLVALLGAVLCACACLVGCERKEAASPEPPAPVVSNAPVQKVVSRADDPAYQAKLQKHIATQRRTNVSRARVLAQMAQIREQAKKALPADATDAQVVAEIEGNPGKYPAWRELAAALEKNAEEIQRNRASATATVRRRLLRETTERPSAKQ